MSNDSKSSYKKLLSNTLVFAVGSFSSKVLVLLLIPIYTSHLSRAELGVTDVLTQIANWMIPLATMTISEAIIRFGLDKAYDKKKVFTLGNLVCGFGMAVFAVLLPIVSFTGLADKYIGGYSLLLFLYVFMSGVKTLYTTFVRAMERVKLFALAGIIGTFFTLFFTAMFYIVLPQDFLGRGTGIQKYLLATILADLITTVFVTFAAKLWRYIDFKDLDRELLQTMLQYSVPLIPAQLLWLITNSSDSFMTTHYLGSARNGILAAAYKIPNIVATVYMMFGQAWNMSAITENDSDSRDRFYENVFDFNQSLLYILAGGCMLIIQPLTHLMIGREFQECVRYSPILIYSTIFSCFTTFMGSIYLASRKTRRSLFTSLVSGIINVGLNVILIPRIGLYGPPLSTVASYVTVFIIRAVDSRKLVPFKMDLKKMAISNVLLLTMLGILLKYPDITKNSRIGLAFILLVLFCAVFIINMQSISGLFFKFLPRHIAQKLSEVGRLRLTIQMSVLMIFGIVNLFTYMIPLLVVLLGGVIYGLYREIKPLWLGSTAAFVVLLRISSAFLGLSSSAWCITFAGLTLLSVFPMLRYFSPKSVAFTVLSFDLFICAAFSALAGVFILLLETIFLLVLFRNIILDIAQDYAKSSGRKKKTRP